MKIFCAIALNERQKAILRNGLGAIPSVFADELKEQQRLPEFLRSDVCFGNVPPSWLVLGGHLKWLQLESAGFGEYQNVARNTSAWITNLKGYFSGPVAESALAGILALYRGINTLTDLQRERKWVGGALRPHLRRLENSSVLILGGGGIGQHLKKLLEPFEAEVTVFGRQPQPGVITKPSELDEVLPAMDIVASCLPETNETIGLINARRLRLLAPHAVFVNVGRGSVVDEPALIALLQEQKIGGCVLDVTAREPLPPDHPLWSCPNTILTQHTGGGFAEEIDGKVYFFLENLERFKKGKEPLNVVELEKGY